MSKLDIDHLKTWEGTQEVVSDRLRAETAQALAATLDMGELVIEPGDALPLTWQWLYFNPVALARDLDVDGHPKLGGFLPPVPLPRRMWAAGSMQSHQPLKVDVPAERRSTIKSVDFKQGRSGGLVFITVEHAYWQSGACVLLEQQDIVYREEASGSKSAQVDPPVVRPGKWSKTLTPDPVLLFRYSAVTFNSHRIHFDQDYTQNTEGYPGLIVHGPLTATLMLQFVDETVGPGKIEAFSFRAQRPLFANQLLTIHGQPSDDGMEVWVEDAQGWTTTQGQVRLSALD
jgi:3-methylfumaryl-CoA hydratase